jgi:hypothetical protein
MCDTKDLLPYARDRLTTLYQVLQLTAICPPAVKTISFCRMLPAAQASGVRACV